MAVLGLEHGGLFAGPEVDDGDGLTLIAVLHQGQITAAGRELGFPRGGGREEGLDGKGRRMRRAGEHGPEKQTGCTMARPQQRPDLVDAPSIMHGRNLTRKSLLNNVQVVAGRESPGRRGLCALGPALQVRQEGPRS